MPEIYLTPDRVSGAARQMRTQEEELKKFVQKIDSFVNGFLPSWKGDAQKAFINSWNAKKATYEKFVKEDMPNFSKFLENYASTMTGIDSSAKF